MCTLENVKDHENYEYSDTGGTIQVYQFTRYSMTGI